MSQFIITYFGGEHPKTPEEGKKHFESYQQWLQSLGEDVVEPMVPYKNSRTLNADGSLMESSVTSMSGHTIIKAANIDDAIAKVKSCPFFDINGTLEIAEIVEM